MSDTPHIRVRGDHGQVIDVVRLQRGAITIGSAPGNAIVLPSNQVAPVHARLDLDAATNGVTVTDLGSNTGTFVGNLRIQPHASFPWDGSQLVRIGPYTLKLIGTAHGDRVEPAAQAPANRFARRRWLVALAALLALLALGILISSILARPAEIVSFALVGDVAQRIVEFQVRNAQRITLLVNGQPADRLRLSYNASTGEGAFQTNSQEREFELTAYNALNQPTTNRLTLSIERTPTPTPNPTATPLPNDPFIAEFSFNGVNKVNDLSDIAVNKGDPLVIAWNVANAGNVELQPGGTFKATDSIRVSPSDTTVYTLIARNDEGEAKRAVKVIVIDAQATAAASATASASAKATQDALASVQVQAAATATASARATATALANLLANTQATVQAIATQEAQAVLNATSTAVAQATAQAASTAQASATQQANASANATATAIAQARAQADAARFSQFNGVWVNDDPNTIGVTRLIVSNSGPSITAQAYAKCQPQDCFLGARTQTFTDAPLTVRFDFGDGSSRTLRLERTGEKLRVEDIDSRGPVRTYTFSRE